MADTPTLDRVLRIRVTDEQLAALKRQAASEQRSVGFVARRAILRELRTRKGKL